jgi:hypothetical protein
MFTRKTCVTFCVAVASCFSVISIAGLIVSTVSGSKAGPILVIIGCVFFLPLGLIAGLGAQKALNAMKRQAA